MTQYEKSLGAPQIDKDEHVFVNGVNAKRVVASGFDGTNLQDLKVTSAGALSTVEGMSLPEFDTVEADSSILPTSVVFKLSGATVATLTITYPTGGIKVVRS